MDTISSLEGLRLTALKSKGYTAEQIAALAEAVEELITPLQEHAESAHAPANAEENTIVGIRRNGTAVPPEDKVVDIAVPEKTSELENDSGFINETQMNEAVGGAGHLKKLVVEALPAVSDADANTIYYVRKNEGVSGNQYKEYQLINGAFEIIGNDDVDLAPFATVKSVEKADEALINSIYETATASAEKYVGTGNLATFWALLKPLFEGHELSINDLVARVALLELTTNASIQGNSYYVTFESLTGLKAAGVWNETDGRIEF